MPSPPLALRILLLATLAAVIWLVRPFLDALLVATVAAILAWPLHLWLVQRVRGPRSISTALTVILLTVGVVVPVGGLFWLVSRELAALATQLAAELDRGDLASWGAAITGVPLVQWLVDQAGGAPALTEALRTTARDGLLGVAKDVGQYVPGFLGVTARALLDLCIFYLALTTLFHRGAELRAWAKRMIPLAEAHTTRLFEVFAEFARNVVLAGVVAAMVQGAVAGVGYWLAGVDRPILFAVLTGVLAFIPLVGSAVAWVPVALLLLLQDRAGAALFITIWSIGLTGTVDNLVKPLIVRGRSDMPTLLVFLGVFGGLTTFGVIGLLVGPVLMALLLALLHIYEEG
ncbi:hypothetical protein LBMAG42_10980 [Deltaproteobacteria bacterium]|nr:hypothetical protein LBMAG42_10980 [Deltaproteobacteria bacterium]